MSERIKACFDAPEPSDDLRRRIQALPLRKKGFPPPMQLKIFTGVATAVVLCGFWAVRNRPTVPHEPIPTTHQEPLHQPLTNTVGERMFRIYDYGWNRYGEFYLLYTAGKLPKDAWITDEKGTNTYRDTSITTQDWRLSAVTSDAHMVTPADGDLPSQLICHLPIRPPIGMTPGQVPPGRIAPDGCKFEAAVLRFPRKPTAERPECFLMFTAPPRNYHAPELLSFVRKIAPSHSPWPTVTLRLASGPSTLAENEHIPAAWERYGIDVAETTRQLEGAR